MPSHVGRNPQSYPPNDNYRREWDRIFGKKGAKEPEGKCADVLAHLTRATRERYFPDSPREFERACDELGKGRKP